jgi:hypothetical protein
MRMTDGLILVAAGTFGTTDGRSGVTQIYAIRRAPTDEDDR